MTELELLTRRQELLEQAARLQRATIAVRLYKMETNKMTMVAQTVADVYRKLVKSPTSLAVAMGAVKWVFGRFSKKKR